MIRLEKPTNTRESVSSKILQQAMHLAEKAEQTSNLVCNKLESVMSPPRVGDGIENVEEEMFPKYFDDLRKHLHIISKAINIIEEAIERTEF